MKKEYFWEYGYPFGEFLKKIFQDKYKRKYSLEGNGIFNLLYIDNKIYEIKFTEAKKLLENDNKKFTDKNKLFIVEEITKNLKSNFTVNGGKFITFELDGYIAKIEIIKKMAEPR